MELCGRSLSSLLDLMLNQASQVGHTGTYKLTSLCLEPVLKSAKPTALV